VVLEIAAVLKVTLCSSQTLYETETVNVVILRKLHRSDRIPNTVSSGGYSLSVLSQVANGRCATSDERMPARRSSRVYWVLRGRQQDLLAQAKRLLIAERALTRGAARHYSLLMQQIRSVIGSGSTKRSRDCARIAPVGCRLLAQTRC
jgi:hypothetical protein